MKNHQPFGRWFFYTHFKENGEFAWVPHGDTCAFCIVLASNGWREAGPKTLKGTHAEHVHAHCNCEYAIRFDDRISVAGYHPENYLAQYWEVDGDLNAIRRDRYAKHKDLINAQKRAAYARRKAAQAEQEQKPKTHGKAAGTSHHLSKHLVERGKGPITQITDEAIEKVPVIEIFGATENENQKLQQWHQTLLRLSRDKNNNNETAIVLSSDFQRSQVVFGNETSIEFQSPPFGMRKWLLHNHPRNSSFSFSDVREFLGDDSLFAITIVKNNGHTEILTKQETYNRIEMEILLKRKLRKIKVKNDSEYDKAIVKFIEEAEKKGALSWMKK